jgi:phospholipase/carboxylesterase
MLKPAAEGLMRMVDGYSASVGLDAQQFDLMGFSQGAAMVNLMGMLYPARVRKMGVLAGFVPSGFDALIGQKPLSGKTVFVAHGTKDDMVPLDRARSSIELLKMAGAQVIYCEDHVGHKLSASCLHALEKYLKD